VAAITVAANAAAMGAHRATAIGFVSAFSRLPVHPANTKANNRALILIRAIPFCQVSKQERRREWECAIIGIGGWKYDPRENREARDHALPLGASGGGDRLRAECAQAGFCHEDLFMSDSAMPGLRWWLGRGPTCVVRITLHVGPLLK
jgi:hypothetical protein